MNLLDSFFHKKKVPLFRTGIFGRLIRRNRKMTMVISKSSTRLLISSLFLATCISLHTSVSWAQTVGIAAVVNYDVVTIYDVEDRVKMLIVTSEFKDSPQLRQRLTRQVLNRLINEKLKMQEANRLGIRISRKQLEKVYTDMESQNNLPSGGLTNFLWKNGVERTVLLNQIEAAQAWASAVNMTFRSLVTVSEEEIDEVISEIQSSKGKPEYLTSEIFLPVDNPNRAPEILKNANQLMEQLSKGASFQALARNYSQSASAAVEGDLGWIRQGQLAQEINNALIPLKKSSIAPPIRTVAGYHIILKRDERTGKGLPPSNTKLDLHKVFLPLPANASSADIANLSATAKNMAASATSCADMEKLEKESSSPLSGSLGIVETSALPELVQNAVRNLPVGTASQPIPSEGGIIFLMVCSRTETSALETLRPKIKQRLMGERLDVSARGYLRDLRNAAFLDVRI